VEAEGAFRSGPVLARGRRERMRRGRHDFGRPDDQQLLTDLVRILSRRWVPVIFLSRLRNEGGILDAAEAPGIR
jgi:hypothetical protein